MIGTLSRSERRLGFLLSVLLAMMGLTMAAAARHGAMAAHGFMALALGVGLVFVVGGALYDAPPRSDRMCRYYDAPTRFGIVMTLTWAMIGMGAGVWAAALLYWPEASPLWPATSFGRLRPVHTTGIIFGFGALIATSFHVLQRTSRARLADSVSPWVVLLGFNLFCLWAVTGYLMGSTRSKRWPDDAARSETVCHCRRVRGRRGVRRRQCASAGDGARLATRVHRSLCGGAGPAGLLKGDR